MFVEWMEQSLIVEETPEMLRTELVEMGDRLDEDASLPFVMKGARQMMMVDHVRPLFRPDHDRDHVLPEIFGLEMAKLIPLLSLRLDLDQADRDLGRPKRSGWVRAKEQDRDCRA